MKYLKIFLTIIVLGIIAVSMIGCNSSKSADTTSTQAPVSRGNISLDISAAGNLEYSTTQDLTFDLFYPKATVGEVSVEAGDTVQKGQILASIDSSEWDEQIQALTDALTTAQRQVTVKERALDTANRNVSAKEQLLTTAQRQITTLETAIVTTERQITSKEIALDQAEIDVQTAQCNLDTIIEVKTQQDIIETAQKQLDFIATQIADSMSPGADPRDYQYWLGERTRVQKVISDAEQEKTSILAGTSVNISSTVAIAVAQKQLAIQTAQLNLDNANQAIIDALKAVDNARQAVEDASLDVDNALHDVNNAKLDVSNAQTDLDDAEQAVTEAQNTIDEAKAANPDIIAPFDGFVSAVNVQGGDEVLKGTVAFQIADPNKFEADILVSEMDIPQVKIGTAATVSVSALSGVSLPATVTQISPTATIQSGVVNYSVKVEVDSQAILQAQSGNLTTASGNTTSTGLPPMLQRAVDSGRMTLEQAQELAKQGEQGNFTPRGGMTTTLTQEFRPPEGFSPPEGAAPPEGFIVFGRDTLSGSSGQSQGQLPTSTISGNIELKQGYTVTISVIVAQRTDVLLVPTGAVTVRGGQSYVEVVAADGTAKSRLVETGLSDWQNTEITSGLDEGEKVLVTTASTSSSSSSSGQRQGSGGFFLGR